MLHPPGASSCRIAESWIAPQRRLLFPASDIDERRVEEDDSQRGGQAQPGDMVNKRQGGRQPKTVQQRGR
jgi:hypothetical protein